MSTKKKFDRSQPTAGQRVEEREEEEEEETKEKNQN